MKIDSGGSSHVQAMKILSQRVRVFISAVALACIPEAGSAAEWDSSQGISVGAYVSDNVCLSP
ncbi:MAG: hypothetical protein ACI87W_003690, partial [Halieaceae bacterium]